MKNQKLMYRIAFTLIIGFVFSACAVISPETDQGQEEEQPIGMANPAAVYCEGLGYTLESVERDGGMDADCVFPNGERCAQWDFLSGRCGGELSYCTLQGGTILEFGNMGICEFSDGSTCGEFQYFSGSCGMGDNPSVGEEQTEIEEEEIEEEVEEVVDEVVQLKDFTEARDYLAAYFAEEFKVEVLNEWMEQDISSPDAPGVTTYRYVAGPMTIVLSAEASAPYASLYTVKEASNLANGFYWTGTVSLDGTIIEEQVNPPLSILNPEQAREAALGYLYATHEVSSPMEWVDLGMGQSGDYKSAQKFSSGSWLVEVQFEPAAPFVSSYQVMIENSSLGLLWEGVITSQGQVTQTSYIG